MSGLTEFLLARVAEDEGDIADIDGVNWTGERVRAECEAKRRIVEHYQRAERCALDEDHDPDSLTECAWLGQGVWEVLHMLAAVYADHPDYSPEWAL